MKVLNKIIQHKFLNNFQYARAILN